MALLERLRPDRVWHALRAERFRRRLFLAWLSFAVFELLLSFCDLTPVPWGPGLVELGGLVAIGLVHAALAAEDWRGSAAWPVLGGIAVIVWRLSFEIVRLSFRPVLAMVPFAGLGFLVLVYWLVRLLDRRVWRRVPAVPFAFVALLLLRLAVVGPRQTIEPVLGDPDPTSDGPPIVVVTVDTLRADAAAGMSSFARLAERGAHWSRATAPSSWTWPSIVTLWSGVPAQTHGAGRIPGMRYRIERRDPDLRWLPRALGEAGYLRAAFVTNPVIRMMKLSGSFDRYVHGEVVSIPLALAGYAGGSSDGDDGRRVVDAAIDWLEDAPERGFLLWVHLLEPHLPYRHADERLYDFNALRKLKMGSWFLDDAEREAMRRAYDREVAYADEQILRLIDALERRGHFEDGVLVLTADHGEEFWEHNGFEHGHSHHGEVIDVPLALVAPGVAPGERDGVAAVQDIAPTLAGIAGLEWPGLDLRRPIPASRVAHAFGNLYFRPMRSARVGTTRVIVDGERIEAYDLLRDPGEHDPRIVPRGELASLTGPPPEADDSANDESLDLDTRALRALGYVH